MTSPTFEVSGSVIAFADSGTATTFSVTPEAVTFDVVNVAGYTVAVTELDQLSDVDTSGVANGDALVYDSGTWVAGTVASSGGTASVVLAGDVVGTAVAGTVTTDIAPSGVAAGTYGSSGTAVVLTVGADGRITSIAGTAISGGGSLPSQTGHAGEVLATDGSSAGWQDYVEKTATGTTAGVSWGGGAAALTAVNGSGEASAQVTPAGTEMYAADGTDEKYVRVLPDGFHVVGDVGEAVLSGDDYLMSTASDTDVQAPGATFARARGDLGTPTAVTDGDILAYPLYAQGHDGTGLVLAGQITAEVDGTVATGKVPTRIRIATADADGVLTDRLVLNPDGTSELNGTLLDLDTSGASTGDVATWDGTKVVLDTPTGGGGGIAATIVDAKGDLIAATAADTVARLAVSGTNGRVLTEDSGETTGLKWGANAATSRLWTPGSGVTTADEFDDGSLDAAWTRVDKSGGTGRATWTEAAGCLSLLTDGTSTTDSAAELHGLVRSYALSVGEYIETHITWAGKDGNYPMAGLVIADGATFNAGTQVVGSMYRSSAGGADVMQIASWTNWATRGTFTDAGGPGTRIGPYLRLKRTETSDYALYTSPDGVSWALLNTRTGVSFTPAYVGFACSLWGAAVQFAWSFGYFRIGS